MKLSKAVDGIKGKVFVTVKSKFSPKDYIEYDPDTDVIKRDVDVFDFSTRIIDDGDSRYTYFSCCTFEPLSNIVERKSSNQ